MSTVESNRGCSRRSLIQCGVAAATFSALSGAAQRSQASETAPDGPLQQEDVILFQGDSITDAGREKNITEANSFRAMGQGYANMIASALLGKYSRLRLQCYSRGISGNKVPDLQARWQKDTIELKPAVLSILIGVNDFWHKLGGNYDGTVADYEQGFTQLLTDTRAALPKTQLVICEPFVLKCGAVNDEWLPEFAERRAVAKRVTQAAGAAWVPFQTMFDEAVSELMPPDYWAGDGVHPTMAGHALMAKTWLDVTGLG